MNNIDEIISLISWNRSDVQQQTGIDMARNVKCLRAFFRPVGPGYSKDVWENCARIICERSDVELMPYFSDMLLWLEDLNWPGAELIQQRLQKVQNVDMLALAVDNLVPALEVLKKESWLIFVAELLDNHLLKERIHESTLHMLSKYYSWYNNL